MPARALTAEQLSMWRTFLRAHAVVIDVLARELEAERDMPLAFYEVLVHLSESDEGRLRMNELAQAVLLSRSGLTRLVDRMEQAGFVAREACPSDRRGSFAVLTDKGAAALDDAWPVHVRGVAEHFISHLSPDEIRTLSVALGRVADAIAGPDDPGSCGVGSPPPLSGAAAH